MTDQERKSMYIANCLCCTLAEVMKACQVCLFRIGLQIKAEQAQKEEIEKP